MTAIAHHRAMSIWPNGPFGIGETTSVRAATGADRPFARHTHHVAFRDLVERRFGKWDEQQQDGFFEFSWSKLPHEIVLSNGEPCGYVCVEDRPADVYLHELVVHPDWQGRGIGTAVLNAVIEYARVRGVPVGLRTHVQ